MHSTTVAVDLAKNVFELAVADAAGRIVDRQRLNRVRFSSFFVQRAPCRVLMEACGSAHYWARRIAEHGHTVQLLPAQYVRQYVRRNKTDRADAAALIEAARCVAIRPDAQRGQGARAAHRADRARAYPRDSHRSGGSAATPDPLRTCRRARSSTLSSN